MLTIDVLTVGETESLRLQETRIESGLKTFFGEVGAALGIIQSDRLYREGFNTFEEYCQTRWGFGDNYARKLVRASEAIANLKSADVPTLPSSEAQARELTKLDDPEQQIEAWLNACTAAPGAPTATQVKAAVDKVIQLAQSRGSFTPGSTAVVLCGEHKGKKVEISKTEGAAIAHAKLPEGGSYPFMFGELELDAAAPAPEPPPKRNLKAENEALKDALREAIGYLEQYAAPGADLGDWRERAEALLG